MKKQEIHFDDLNRWLFGEAPPVFMIEVFIRTLLIYTILIIVVRLMGKRMAGQTTLNEVTVMITLGAIVSPVMQLPDRALLFAVLVLCCTYLYQRMINWWSFKNEKAEHLTQGKLSLLVKDGRMVKEGLRKSRIPDEQIYAILRERSIYDLAKVERIYLEACGLFSVYETTAEEVHNPIYPISDKLIREEQ